MTFTFWNDGYLLKNFVTGKIPCLGIEPTTGTAKVAKGLGIPVLSEFFGLELAERLAEIEPFKTAIILKFVRDWPYVLFALLMLLPGLFVERFYCRYLCPLGAALAIPASIRTMKWLKRYKQCGDPCQTCSNECMVQAIHPEGNINPNECLYCLHCQVLYYDEHICPVQVKKRKRQDRRELIASDKTASVGRKILDELLADKR